MEDSFSDVEFADVGEAPVEEVEAATSCPMKMKVNNYCGFSYVCLNPT